MSMVVSPFRSNRVTESTIFNKIKAVQSPTKTQEDLLLRIIDSEDISIPDATCCHAYLLLISLFALFNKTLQNESVETPNYNYLFIFYTHTIQDTIFSVRHTHTALFSNIYIQDLIQYIPCQLIHYRSTLCTKFLIYLIFGICDQYRMTSRDLEPIIVIQIFVYIL